MESVFICASDALEEGGKGVRFPVTAGSDEATGFVIRFGGQVHGYLNRCAHVPIELDWAPGEFLESSGLYIMCSTHGAVYEPESGYCAGGPCKGSRLRKLIVEEAEGQVRWYPDDYVSAVIA
jgi:nitrite reductase/ring-hydroxylating ferredoxin subunit